MQIVFNSIMRDNSVYSVGWADLKDQHADDIFIFIIGFVSSI